MNSSYSYLDKYINKYCKLDYPYIDIKQKTKKKYFAFYSAKMAKQIDHTNFYLNDKGEPVEVTMVCQDPHFLEDIFWDDLVYKGIVYEWIAHVSR